MSAFIVSDEQITSIVNFVFSQKVYHGWLGEVAPTELGQILVNENYESVNSLYEKGDTPHEYIHDDPFTVLIGKTYSRQELAQVEMFMRSYEYQSCEHNGWLSSDARSIIDKARKKIVDQILLDELSIAKWTA